MSDTDNRYCIHGTSHTRWCKECAEVASRPAQVPTVPRSLAEGLVDALTEARQTLVVAVRAGMEDFPEFDPAQHVTVQRIDAALEAARKALGG